MLDIHKKIIEKVIKCKVNVVFDKGNVRNILFWLKCSKQKTKVISPTFRLIFNIYQQFGEVILVTLEFFSDGILIQRIFVLKAFLIANFFCVNVI